MTKHVADLYAASLFVEVNGTPLVFGFEPEPEKKGYKCKVIDWAEGQLDVIENRLSRHRMPLIHEGLESYFWARSTRLLRAIGLVLEAFQGVYDLELEFWYITPGDTPHGIEFRVADLNPALHDRIEIQCTNWGTAGDKEENRDAFDKILKESGLCVPTAVLHQNDTFLVQLVDDAAQRPLESFHALVNLHPALAPWSQTA